MNILKTLPKTMMASSLIFLVSVVTLSMFFVSYCRSVMASSTSHNTH